MYVWNVFAYRKNDEELDEISEPYISAEFAMKDWLFNHLEWTHVKAPKFDGGLLEHYQAEDSHYDYILEAQYVNGSD